MTQEKLTQWQDAARNPCAAELGFRPGSPREARVGGKIWVDLDCKLVHLGQHLFGGELAESLRVQGRW
jgi:hypothetical protein